jgi:hypothetical protein
MTSHDFPAFFFHLTIMIATGTTTYGPGSGASQGCSVLEPISVELRDICIFYQPLKKSIKEALTTMDELRLRSMCHEGSTQDPERKWPLLQCSSHWHLGPSAYLRQWIR